MKHLRKLGLASALALVTTCGLVGSASATTIEPGNTALTLSSTNWALAVSGGGTAACTHVTLAGTTPPVGSAATWKTVSNMTLSFAGCTAWGFVNSSVTVSAACLSLHAMGVNAATAIVYLTLGPGCTIDISTPAIGCTVTIAGAQTFGNGTAGSGGFDWTNVNPAFLHVNAVTVPTVHSNGVGLGCPTAVPHTGTMTGTFIRSSATNVLVTP